MEDDWRAGISGKEDRYHLNGSKVIQKEYLDGEPYLCKKCNKVWQPYYGHDVDYPEYIFGFPKVGCTPRDCVRCR